MNGTFTLKAVEKKDTWNKFQRYSNTKDYITPYYNENGTIYTGLSEEDAERLGKILKRDLSARSDYWHDYKIIMRDKPEVFDLSNPENELAYKFLTGGHKRIGSSITDPDLGIKDYYIVDENKEAEIIMNKASLKIKANKIFSGLSTENKKDILRLYPGFITINNISDEVLDAKLYQELEKDPAKFIGHAEDKKRNSKIFLKDLVDAKILRKNKSSYYYGDDFIGHDEESAITYIEDPARQSLKIDLMSQLKDKK